MAAGFLVVFLPAGIGAFCHADQAANKDAGPTIARALENYEAVNTYDYVVSLRSVELEKRITERLAGESGIQMKPSFVLVNTPGERPVVKVELESLPEPYRAKAENRINTQLNLFLSMLAALNSETVPTFLRICQDATQFDVIKSDKEVLDVEMNELNQPVMDKNLKSFRLRINRSAGVVEGQRLHFGQNEFIEMQFEHRQQQLPQDNQKVYLPVTVHVRQTAYTRGEEELPPEFTIRFEAYRFGERKDRKAIAEKKNETVTFLKWRAALDKAGFGDRLVKQENDLVLNLNSTPVIDLAFLKGIPLTQLDLGSTKVQDLSPLRGMSLTSLNLFMSPVSDLSPLQGMPLRRLILLGSQVADLTPLKGMPLTELDAYATKVSDLSPLQGMPLTWLNLSATPITNVAPLQGMPLSRLDLTSTHVADITTLHDLPLKSLSLRATPLTDLTPLKGMRLQQLDLTAVYWLNDINPLQGMPLTNLALASTQVSDLRVLRGMPLESLDLRATPVTDLAPLEGMPLKELELDGCAKIHDLAPLASCKGLERLTIPSQCNDIAFLRQLPNLKNLSYQFTAGNWEKVSTVEEFWKKYANATTPAPPVGAGPKEGSATASESATVSLSSSASAAVSDTVDLVSLAKNRQDWPNEVSLTQKVSVPVIIHGKAYGSTDLPAGMTLHLVQVKATTILVTRGQTTNAVPVTKTDLVARVLHARKASATEPPRDAPSEASVKP